MNAKNQSALELIRRIDPILLSNYENATLGGKRLATMLNRYVKIGNPQERYVRIFRWYILSSFVGVTSFFLLATTSTIIATVVLLLLSMSWIVVLCGPELKRLRRAQAEIAEYEDIFETLAKTIGELGSKRMFISHYDELSISCGLVELAYNILHSEKQLDEVRLHKERMPKEILHWVSVLIRCNNEFECALSAAGKFGLKFKRGELFDRAQTLPRIGGKS